MDLAPWVTPVDIAAGITVIVLLLGIVPLTWWAERGHWKK